MVLDTVIPAISTPTPKMAKPKNVFEPPEKEDEVDLLVRKIPREVRDQFKAYCAKRSRSMTELLIEYMYNCAASEVPQQKPQTMADLLHNLEKKT